MKRRISASLLTTIVFGTLAAPVATAATKQLQSNQAAVILNGAIISKAPVLKRKLAGSRVLAAFIPIGEVVTVLQSVGLIAQWNKTTGMLTVRVPDGWKQTMENLSTGSGHVRVVVNGVVMRAMDAISAPDPATGLTTTFVPIADMNLVLHKLGLHARWNGVAWHLVLGPSVSPMSSSVDAPRFVHQGSNNIVVHVTPYDFQGQELSRNQRVRVSDGSVLFSAVWNASNADYEAVFSEDKPETVTFTATVDGVVLHMKPVTVIKPVLSAAASKISGPASVIAGSANVSITVMPMYQSDEPVGPGHSVTVSDGRSTVEAQWDETSGTYVATFSEYSVGTITFSAAIDGTAIPQKIETTVDPRRISPVNSVVTAPRSAPAGQSVPVDVELFDQLGSPISAQSVVVSDGSSSQTATWNSGKGAYEASFVESMPGIVTFHATADGVALQSTASTMLGDVFTPAKSMVTAAAYAAVGQAVTVAAKPEDQLGNGMFGQTITISDGTSTQTAVWNSANQDYEATFTETKAGTVTFTVNDGGEAFGSSAQTVIYNATLTAPASALTGQSVSVDVTLTDHFEAAITGQSVVISDGSTSQTATWNPSKGAYEASFVESIPGTVTFHATVNGESLQSTASTRLGVVFSPTNSTVAATSYAAIGGTVTVAAKPEDQLGHVMSGQTITISDGTGTESAIWNNTHQDYEATFTESNAGTVKFSANDGGVAFGSSAQTDIEIPMIVAYVNGESSDTATVTNAVYQVTLDSVDSAGRPLSGTYDVVLNMQDLSTELGSAATTIISGVSANSNGPYTSPSVPFPANQTSQRVYAQFNFAGGTGTVTSAPESLSALNAQPAILNATWSKSTDVLTINFDESMNPQSLTTSNVSSNLGVSVGSGPVFIGSPQISWSNNYQTVTCTEVNFGGEVILFNMVSAYGETPSSYLVSSIHVVP